MLEKFSISLAQQHKTEAISQLDTQSSHAHGFEFEFEF